MNPLLVLLENFGALGSDSWTDSMVYISKEIYTIPNISIIVPAAALVALILAVISSVFSSGYMNLYYETLRNSTRKTAEIIFTGIKQFILKTSIVFLQFYLSVIAVVVMIPMATVPSIILAQKALENGSDNFFTTDLLTILTLAVIFMIISFIAMAFIFRFPSLYYFKKRPIEKSKNVVASAFLRYFAPVCLLVGLFIGTEYLLLTIKNNILEFFVGWIFYTLLLIGVSAVSFTGYSMMLRKFKRD
jgi:hypothetical protein